MKRRCWATRVAPHPHACYPQLEKSPHNNEDSAQPKISESIFKKKEVNSDTWYNMNEDIMLREVGPSP